MLGSITEGLVDNQNGWSIKGIKRLVAGAGQGNIGIEFV